MSQKLIECKDEILSANERDLKNASHNNIQPTMIDRLTLNESRIIAMANGVKKVAELPDPIGESDLAGAAKIKSAGETCQGLVGPV